MYYDDDGDDQPAQESMGGQIQSQGHGTKTALDGGGSPPWGARPPRHGPQTHWNGWERGLAVLFFGEGFLGAERHGLLENPSCGQRCKFKEGLTARPAGGAQGVLRVGSGPDVDSSLFFLPDYARRGASKACLQARRQVHEVGSEFGLGC